MKRKIKFVALILALIMLMTACTGGGNSDETDAGTTTETINKGTSDRFFYTNESGKIIRYDVVEKTAAIACPDPFCEHDSRNCPVSKVSGKVYFASDYLSYVKEEFIDENEYLYAEVYLYDTSTGTITTLLSGAAQIYYPWITVNRDYVFFCAADYVFDEHGNSDSQIWISYRYNIETGELEQQADHLEKGFRVIEDTGSRLLWYSSFLGKYFWTDYDYGNIKELDESDYPGETVCGYYIYSDIEWTEYDDYYRTMYRQNIETGEVTLVSDYVSEMRYDDRNSPTGIAYTLFDYNEEYGYNAKSEIWWFDCETLETRLLIDVEDISDEFDIVSMPYSAGYNDYAGGYMMVSIGHTVIKTDDDGDKYMSADYTHRLFINPKTGDWFIMEPLY